MLVTLSMGLQDFEDKEVTTLCLEGLKSAVRVACIFGLTVRTTFTDFNVISGILDLC